MTHDPKTDAQIAADMSDLDNLAAMLDKGHIESTFDAFGFRWKLTTLVDHETAWIQQFVITTSPAAMFFSSRSATLAMAIVGYGKIDELGNATIKPVSEQFAAAWIKENEGVDGKVRAILNSQNPYASRYFFAQKMLEWIGSRPSAFAAALWEKYQLLVDESKKATDAMGKSLRGGGI